MDIPSELVTEPGRQTTYLSDVKEELNTALEQQGYYEKSYYAVPEGFAMATRLEQFLADGASEEPPGRWATEKGALGGSFSLREYMRALFTADPGYYRVIVFIVTPRPLVQKDAEVSQDEATKWVKAGANKLPESIGSREYTQEHSTTALVYEFVQPERGKEATFRKESPLTAMDHLAKARIWEGLEG